MKVTPEYKNHATKLEKGGRRLTFQRLPIGGGGMGVFIDADGEHLGEHVGLVLTDDEFNTLIGEAQRVRSGVYNRPERLDAIVDGTPAAAAAWGVSYGPAFSALLAEEVEIIFGPKPWGERKLAYQPILDECEFDYEGAPLPREVTYEYEANLASSHVGRGVHMPALDIDVPARLVPSSTEGHSHLYIDVPMGFDAYTKLLDALVDAGIIEAGYASASKRRGASYLRTGKRKFPRLDLDGPF